MKNILKLKKFTLTHREKDLYDAIMPVFVLSKILGLAPFRFDCASRRFIPHYGVMIPIRFCVVIGVMWYVAIIVYDQSESINIVSLALRFESYFGAILTSVVLALAVANQKLLIRAVENIIRVDKEMVNLGVNITYKNAQRFSYFQILGISCVFTSKLILQSFTVRKYFQFVYSVFNVVDYVNTIMLFQYVDFLLVLRQRYIWLNREIKKMTIKYFDWKFKAADSKIYSIIRLSNDRNGASKCLSPRAMLEKLGKIHGDLFTTARLINRIYSVQLLFTICARFVMTTTQLINVYKSIQDMKQGDANTYTLMAIYLFLHISKLFMICSISENTAIKARDTGIYLHSLWNLNHLMKDEINFFSLQILHQNLQFSAAGFFVLDYTLMTSIVGAVTTYLIIIIQFDVNKIK